MSEQELITSQIKALTIFNANDTTMLVKECAKFLNIHPNTVTNRIHSGSIIASFQDGKYHIPKLQFLEKLVSKFLNDKSDNVLIDIKTEEEKIAIGVETYFKNKFFQAS